MTRCPSKQVLSHIGAKGHHFLCFKQYYRFMNTTSHGRVMSRTQGLAHRGPVVYSYGTALPFLSHLLIAGCDIGVQISVRPSVRSSVRPSVCQHLRRSLVFSTSEKAASLKPCIVIVPDIPFKHAP